MLQRRCVSDVSQPSNRIGAEFIHPRRIIRLRACRRPGRHDDDEVVVNKVDHPALRYRLTAEFARRWGNSYQFVGEFVLNQVTHGRLGLENLAPIDSPANMLSLSLGRTKARFRRRVG